MNKESKVDFYMPGKRNYEPRFDPEIAAIINDFNAAYSYHTALPAYKPSPLVGLPSLAEKLGIGEILVKNEAERFGIPVIKTLGATYAVHRIMSGNPGADAFCTATDGNHGRAVARAAREASKPATIFVPKYTAQSRIEAIRAEGADVEVVNGDYNHAVHMAKDFASRKKAILIQDTSWKDYEEIPALITAGYYTQMKEIELQTNNFQEVPDIILVQSGVGSWPSAVVHFVRKHPELNNCRIVCIEPYTSDCFLESAKQHKRSTTIKSQETIMAGLNCGTPSLLAWEIMKQGSDAFISISDDFALRAMKQFFYPAGNDQRIASGESGAAGLAGLLALLDDPGLNSVKEFLEPDRNSRIMIFNTEGITDSEFFNHHVI